MNKSSNTNRKLYINRELSWLRFNSRVLSQSLDDKLPLLERLKFIAIYATNLDEFYMIRVANLKRLFKAGVIKDTYDQMTPLQQLTEVAKYIHNENKTLQQSYKTILVSLEKQKLKIKDYKYLPVGLQKKSNDYYFSNIFAVVIPIAVDATHPFPRLNNLSFGMAVKLKHENKNNIEFRYGLVRIPRVLPRFVELENGHYTPIESIVKNHIDTLFPGYTLVDSLNFRIIRNADIEIEEDEASDLLVMMEQGLQLRKKGEIVRLEINKSTSNELVDFLSSHLNISANDISKLQAPLNLGSLWEIVSDKKFAHLLLPKYKQKLSPSFNNSENIFKAIEQKDIILMHPYESFEPVTRFIKEAAKDKDTVSIRMTLYRVGKNSPIVKSLIDAALNGKQVTVMVELKARFDEENNLNWARALESVGAHLIYGVKGLKVHSKVAFVVKNIDGKIKNYTHFSTGNYNPITSSVYTDVSLFTCNKQIGIDVIKFFHHLTGFSKNIELDKLFASPTGIKLKLLSLIAKESEFKNEGYIILKANALTDIDVIKALYKASQNGVKIDLIIRGVCCLRPNINGISDNIRVVSLVGKYLEHSRIYYFKHKITTIYISSADLMARNLESRIELMIPIENEIIINNLLRMLNTQLKDNVLAKELSSNGEYYKVIQEKQDEPINSQLEEEKNTTRISRKLHKQTSSIKTRKHI
jgi:polyphosphate kinase